ncbi:MAG: patatin-like phospholipase family protein [Pseudomonadota bacterium]
MTHLAVWDEKFATPRPRRMLALDGGGILGAITLEILAEIESQLADKTGQGDAFRMGDWFDYIGGTSTGSIIATGLAIGMKIEELITIYRDHGETMFTKRWFWEQGRSFYDKGPLVDMLKQVLGMRTLGAEDLRCLLLVVTRNATTDSPWPLSNNPFAKYNDRSRDDCNLNIPLWELVRASTAAPVFFTPEQIKLDANKDFTFVDGGITPYNNPSFLMYRMATIPQYGLNWATGERDMMILSVGTSAADKVNKDIDERGQLVTTNLKTLPGVLMAGANIEQDINCRSVGRCVFGEQIDRELGDLKPRTGDPRTGDEVPLENDCRRDFLYARYNPDISRSGLDDIELWDVEEEEIGEMDNVAGMPKMREVGQAYARKYVDMTPFERFL